MGKENQDFLRSLFLILLLLFSFSFNFIHFLFLFLQYDNDVKTMGGARRVVPDHRGLKKGEKLKKESAHHIDQDVSPILEKKTYF